ncbi:MAG: GNAT family N-acetyltransferase [Bacteroidales bacterium]|jgi:predicted acetyltransferase|nr:GNAT family N-acetyltransferase [Bacteroidales bacterium]
MIVYADDTLKEEVKKIWKICFPDDSDNFTDFYFDTKYKNENTLVYVIDGIAVACLQMLPYNFTYYHHIIPTAYISGAATLPAFRKKGIMADLLTFAFHEMQRKNIPISVLIPQEPWLIAYYEQLGYAVTFEYGNQVLQSYTEDYDTFNDYKIIPLSSQNNNIDTAYHYYASYFSKQNFCIQKSRADFEAIITFYTLEEGEILTVCKENVICGLCFISQNNHSIIVKDLIVENQTSKSALLNYIIKTHPKNEIILRNPCEENEKCCHNGMLRIINPECMVDIFAKAHPEITFNFSLLDNQMTSNKGYYSIKNGKSMKTDVEFVQNKKLNDTWIDINLLSTLLTGYQIKTLSPEFHFFPSGHPFMSLMLE